MTGEIICVGTELLLGNIVNTNAAYLAQECAKIGLNCLYQTVVGDNMERLSLSIKEALKRSDIILMSGGLGPTQDDLTKEAVAKVLGKELVLDENSKERIKAYFGEREITDNNWKQAYIPEGAKVLDNENGTAPGIIVSENGHHIVLLPGPPGELKPMFENQVKPFLCELDQAVIYSQMVKICGVSESLVETKIKDLIETQSNPTIAPYAKLGEVHLRVTAKAEDEKAAKKLVKPVVKELKARFGEDIYSTNEEQTLESEVVDLLKANDLSLSLVESCTGGMLSARLVGVPGISDCYKAGFVTYSNKSKKKAVAVKSATLEKYGAVSEKTAKEMAKGAALITKADAVVSITGIAGPGGGTQEKPVGTVFIGCYVCGTTVVKEFHFKGNRAKIRENATVYALIMLRKCILEYYSKETFGKN